MPAPIYILIKYKQAKKKAGSAGVAVGIVVPLVSTEFLLWSLDGQFLSSRD